MYPHATLLEFSPSVQVILISCSFHDTMYKPTRKDIGTSNSCSQMWVHYSTHSSSTSTAMLLSVTTLIKDVQNKKFI